MIRVGGVVVSEGSVSPYESFSTRSEGEVFLNYCNVMYFHPVNL